MIHDGPEQKDIIITHDGAFIPFETTITVPGVKLPPANKHRLHWKTADHLIRNVLEATKRLPDLCRVRIDATFVSDKIAHTTPEQLEPITAALELALVRAGIVQQVDDIARGSINVVQLDDTGERDASRIDLHIERIK